MCECIRCGCFRGHSARIDASSRARETARINYTGLLAGFRSNGEANLNLQVPDVDNIVLVSEALIEKQSRPSQRTTASLQERLQPGLEDPWMMGPGS